MTHRIYSREERELIAAGKMEAANVIGAAAALADKRRREEHNPAALTRVMAPLAQRLMQPMVR